MAITAHLEIEAGAERQRFELPEAAAEIVIGRSADCQWIIPSGAVSRRHAVLRRRGDELVVEDLGSSNGTMVNGERLSGPRTLRDRDKLQLGAVEIRVVIPEPEPAADATMALDATRRMPPEPPAQHSRVAAPPPPPPAPQPQHSGTTATKTVPPQPPPPLPSAETPSRAPSPTPPSPPTPAPSPPSSSFTPAPSGRREVPAAPSASAEMTGPSMLELAVIAAGSFLVVFGVGAALIRFVF
jgi:pSer/pThr/pTyr-binding forkhead associated (FHA) protein